MSESGQALSDPVQQAIEAIARMHANHEGATTPSQRFIGRIVDRLGRPAFLIALLGTALAWSGGNFLLQTAGQIPIDPPPFAWLELVASVASLCITVLILATQRRDDELAQRREQMTLQLSILNEQKLAKIIELLEESRRDNPLLADRVDSSAQAMATPTDPDILGNAPNGMPSEIAITDSTMAQHQIQRRV